MTTCRGKIKFLFNKLYCPFVKECLETSIIFPFGSEMLNKSWNCFSYCDKVCMVKKLCKNFVLFDVVFGLHLRRPHSRFFYSFCVFLTIFWGDGFHGRYGSNCRLLGICDNTECSFFTDSISFYRISVSFSNA